MEDLLRQARLVADSDAERADLRRLRHRQGAAGARDPPRESGAHDRPFVAVNCGAIPGELLESELFGHARGAFTGAVQAHKGLFQAADGGTLFLDEIGDMPLPLQVKLLRVLQEGEVRPVGSTQAIPVDVRVISATHRDLDAAQASGQFREDLYYRLNVVSLRLPSLAERREDIPLLATHFLRKLAERYRKPVPTLAPEAMALLVAAPWPGNVRQLLNLLEQAVALTTTIVIPASAGPERAAGGRRGAGAVRGSAQDLRARLPRAPAEDHRRQRHAGGAAGQAQPDRVLQAAAAAPSRARDVQGTEGLKRVVVTTAGRCAGCRVAATANFQSNHRVNAVVMRRVGRLRQIAPQDRRSALRR